MKNKKEKNNQLERDIREAIGNKLDGSDRNSTSGITLIALVVTIIVLIILAGISISLILGDNGIITKAQLAKQAQEKAEIIENMKLEIAGKEAEKLQNTDRITVVEIEEILSKYGTVNKEGDIIISLTPAGKDYEIPFEEIYGGSLDSNTPVTPEEPEEPETYTYTVTFSGTNVTSDGASKVNENEKYTATLTVANGYIIETLTVKMGETTLVENTDYTCTNKILTILNVVGNIEITAVARERNVSDLEVGDYIKYDTGSTAIGDNGVVLCRVLYNDATHGLQIITDKNITQKVDGVDTAIEILLGVDDDYAASVESYNNAIETLNNEAEKYLNTAYAYDARCVGSAPTVENGMFINKDKIKFEGTTEYVVPGATNYVTLKFTNTSYIKSLNTDINYEEDQTAMQEEGVEIWTTGEEYWLASHNVMSGSAMCLFFVRRVYTDGSLSGSGLLSMQNIESAGASAYGNGLRPCFSMKSDIKIGGEDGKTAETAYVIE